MSGPLILKLYDLEGWPERQAAQAREEQQPTPDEPTPDEPSPDDVTPQHPEPQHEEQP